MPPTQPQSGRAPPRRLHPSKPRTRREAFPDSGALAIHSNSSFKSRADCQRLSGSFARHFCSTRSSAAGATSAIDGAGRSIIAAITLAGDEPSNARLPVSISYSTKPNEKMSLRGPAILSSDLLGRHVLERSQDFALAGQRHGHGAVAWPGSPAPSSPVRSPAASRLPWSREYSRASGRDE